MRREVSDRIIEGGGKEYSWGQKEVDVGFVLGAVKRGGEGKKTAE